ncbi:MAG: SRPBCC family protein [Pseudomonadales bacterium]
MADRIEKTIDLAAPVSRVWRALTDHEEFGAWFRVALDGPFELGKVTRGKVTYPGFEHLPWQARVEEIEPERLFAFTWPQYDVDNDVDYADAPWTRVEFRLEPSARGTRLTIVESGFEALPEGPRATFLRSNDEGWTAQTANIRDHVEG